ncbi:MAG TPA: DUF2127 domain-containing protein [Povalibacter sp.]
MAVGAFGIRTIAVFEAIKGLLVVAAGFGLLSLIHHDAQHVAEQLVRHMHLDPARRYPTIFIEAASRLNDVRLWVLALAAGGYATMRLLEAWGLWHQRSWAEWLAVISGCIYIPFEIYELSRGVNPLRMVTFTANVIIVIVMSRALFERRRVAVRTS